jgi:hypothetical protein
VPVIKLANDVALTLNMTSIDISNADDQKLPPMATSAFKANDAENRSAEK